MSNFSEALITGGDQFNFTSDQLHPLGFRVHTKDGRTFRYSQAGGTTLAPGKLYQSAAPIPDHLATTATATALGLKQLTFTPAATAGAANLYAEGYLQVDTTPGEGYTYRVSGHAAITASVAFTLYLEDPLQGAALSTASRLGLVHNMHKNVILVPTARTGTIAGVAPAAVTNAYYGWLQTWGPCSVLINGTPAVTSPVANSATTTGAVDVWTTAAAAVTITPVGHMMQVGVSTKYNFVFLNINP